MRFSLLILALLAAGCNTRPTQETVAATTPDAPLRETRWVLRQLGSQRVMVPAKTREAFLTLRTDGTVWGKGYNGNGQLGNGSTLQLRPIVRAGEPC